MDQSESHRKSMAWLAPAEDLAKQVARATKPATFLLGAGCSLSSGCPTTARVHSALDDAMSGRLGAAIKELIHEIPAREVSDVLLPLFSHSAPGVGYYSLAALARSRRVFVLNLNWDSMVQRACADLGVHCTSCDIDERDSWPDLDKLQADPGVTVIHLHGTLESNPRYGSMSTLKFDQDQKDLLSKALRYTTIVAGTTLVGDTDMVHLLNEVDRSQSADGHSIWQFTRTGSGVQTSFTSQPSPIRSGVGVQHVADANFDFDKLMVTVLGAVRNCTYDSIRKAIPWIELPSFSELVLPARSTIRECLPPRSLVVLVGEPQLGKTTLAHLLAFLYSLWNAEPKATYRTFEGPHATMAALAGVEKTSGIYVLEGPFGATSTFEENPGFLQSLSNGKDPDPVSATIVTSRLSTWRTACSADETSGSIPTLSPNASEWYTTSNLKSAFPLSDGSRQDILDRIDSGELNTPCRVSAALAETFVNAASQNGNDAAATEKLAVLEQHPELARLCALVRLQEFLPQPIDKKDLVALDPPQLADVYLRSFEFEGEEKLVLRHSTDREAVDRFLSSHADSLVSWLEARPGLHARDFVEAINFWKVLSLVKQGQVEAIDSLERDQLVRWCAALLSAHPHRDTLDRLTAHNLDPWAAVELAYELVRLWPSVRTGSTTSNALLVAFAENRSAHGTYALVEACLYLRHTVSQQVFAAVESSLWKLIDSASPADLRECILIIDAFAWRPMPTKACEEWVKEFVRRHGETPEWLGFKRFCAAYHPAGLAQLPAGDQGVTSVMSSAEADIVSWLIRWHFTHQAHSRTLLSRSRLVDKDFLCRALHPSEGVEASKEISRLIDDLGKHEAHRGWAFHVGCNLLAFGSSFDGATTGRMRELVRTAQTKDLGIITATLTYGSTLQFATEVRQYLAAGDTRDLALRVAANGVSLDGTLLRSPRFMFLREPVSLQRDYQMQWPKLRQAKIDTLNLENLSNELMRAAEQLIKTGAVPPKVAYEIVSAVVKGDLREIETAVTARDSDRDVYLHIVQAACALRQSQGQLF